MCLLSEEVIKIIDESKIKIFKENAEKEFSDKRGNKFKNFSWEIFYGSLDERDFGAVLVLLEEREILLERIRISRIKRMLEKSDKELRHELNMAIFNKAPKLKRLRKLIRECERLEESNK